MANQFSLLDLLSPKVNASIPINQSRQANSYQTSSTNTYAPVSTFTDSRQLVLVLNSPNATTSTKKNDAVSASSTPTSNPMLSASPSAAGNNSATPNLSLPSLFGGISTTAIIIGAVVIGAIVLIKKK